MATRELPKLIFHDEDLPTMQYKRRQASETELALRDVDRTLEREVRDERVEILGLVSPEAGLAAEIEDVCTLDIIDSIELPAPSERSYTVDDLPAIPISEQAFRRAERRRATRVVTGVALGVVIGLIGTLTLFGADAPTQAQAAPASAASLAAVEAMPEIVPSAPIIEPVVENSPAPAPVKKVDRLVAKKAVASSRKPAPARRMGPAALRTPAPSPSRSFRPPPRKKPRSRASRQKAEELADLLGL